MPITEVTMYRVTCDHKGCKNDLSAQKDYEPLFEHPQAAIDEAREYDWDAVDGHVFCEEHGRPGCDQCGERDDEMTTDGDGERWCSACVASAEPVEVSRG